MCPRGHFPDHEGFGRGRRCALNARVSSLHSPSSRAQVRGKHWGSAKNHWGSAENTGDVLKYTGDLLKYSRDVQKILEIC